jgi:hypothetical protein
MEKNLKIGIDAQPNPIVATNKDGVKIVEINNNYYGLDLEQKQKLLKTLVEWCESELTNNK